MSIIDQRRPGPGLGDVAAAWLDLWDEADAKFEALPAEAQRRVAEAGHGLEVLPASFTLLDPDLRREVTAVLRQMVAVLSGDCGVSRLPERCPPDCAHRHPER